MKDFLQRTCFLALLITFLLLLFPGLALAAGSAGPLIVRYSPPAGEVSVGTDSTKIPIEVYFDDVMNASTVNATNFFVKNTSGSTITASVSYDGTQNKAVLVLSPSTTKFTADSKYFITVKGGSSGIKNSSGVPTDFNWAFTAGSSDYNVPHQKYTSSTGPVISGVGATTGHVHQLLAGGTRAICQAGLWLLPAVGGSVRLISG